MANGVAPTIHPPVDNPVDGDAMKSGVARHPSGYGSVIHTFSARIESYPRLYPRGYARPNWLARWQANLVLSPLDKDLRVQYYLTYQDFLIE